MTHVIFTGGGTAGHLFPGLAVAGQLAMLQPQVRITFAGSGAPIERHHVRAQQYDYLKIPCHPLPGRVAQLLPFVYHNLTGYRIAGYFLEKWPAAAVVGLGGYVSVPMALAALRRQVPLAILEQNVVAGRANRWLAPRAQLVCAAFGQSKPWLRTRDRFVATGNPVRAGFAPRTIDFKPSKRLLLICGGSHGANDLNVQVPMALAKIGGAIKGWRVIHQAGPRAVAATQKRYAGLGVPVAVVPFIEHMPQLLAEADLVVSRAGGTTLAELAAAGAPAVLCPYPHARDDHQRRNARLFESAGACSMFDAPDVSGDGTRALAAVLSVLLVDGSRRQAMSAAMLRLARPDAARQVAHLVAVLAGCPAATADLLRRAA